LFCVSAPVTTTEVQTTTNELTTATAGKRNFHKQLREPLSAIIFAYGLPQPPQGPDWLTAVMQKSRLQDGRQRSFIYSTTTFLIWHFGLNCSILNYDSRQNADYFFCLDATIWKINNCCHAMCDSSVRVPRGWRRRHHWASCFFYVADLYGDSSQSCI